MYSGRSESANVAAHYRSFNILYLTDDIVHLFLLFFNGYLFQGYMNMSRNPHVQGQLHATGSSVEKKRCTQLYSNTTFQEYLMQRAPLVRVMQRLYNVGVEVNRHQLKDLSSCDTENPQRFHV